MLFSKLYLLPVNFIQKNHTLLSGYKSTIWSNINGIWWQPSTSCTANSKPNVLFVNVLRCQGPLLDRLTCTYIRAKHAVAIQPVGELSNGWFYWRGQLTFSPTPLKETSDHYCQPQLSTLNGYWAVWWGLWECARVCVWNLCLKEMCTTQVRKNPHMWPHQAASVFHQESDRCTMYRFNECVRAFKQ